MYKIIADSAAAVWLLSLFAGVTSIIFIDEESVAKSLMNTFFYINYASSVIAAWAYTKLKGRSTLLAIILGLLGILGLLLATQLRKKVT